MRTFQDKKAERKFAEILEAMASESERVSFVEEVKALRDDKITSEEGKYSVYLVTEREVMSIAKNYV